MQRLWTLLGDLLVNVIIEMDEMPMITEESPGYMACASNCQVVAIIK